MNQKPQDKRDGHKQRIEDVLKKGQAPEPTTAGAHGRPVAGGAPETPGSVETFPRRTQRPGNVGLANEARPGLGTRRDDADPRGEPDDVADDSSANSEPKATKRAYEEPRPAPREQAPDSLAHEQERSTGVSGHSGGS